MSERRHEQGFTLVEILATLSVTLIGMAGLLQLHTTMSRGNQVSGRQLEASNIAEQTLEALRGMTLTQIESAYGPMPLDVQLAAQKGRGDLEFRRQFTAAVVGTSPLELIKLRVQVGWTDQGAEPGAEGGLYDHTIALELLRSQGESQ